MNRPIRIRGARQHNLKEIDLDLPRNALTVITGRSGSGKSSLALDTLFAAGQRRYVESLSTYAKQFLDRLQKPDVDRIEGLSPAVAIEQRNRTTSSRSTVGTATEVYDYLRLLYARAGRTHCPECDDEVRPDSVGGAVDRIAEVAPGTRLMVAFPLARSGRVSHRDLARNLRAMGFVRALADGVEVDVANAVDVGDAGESGRGVVDGDPRRRNVAVDVGDATDSGRGGSDASGGSGAPRRSGGCATTPPTAPPDLATAREALVVVDRVKVPQACSAEWRERLADSLTTCFREGEGEAVVLRPGAAPGEEMRFTERFRCPRHPKTTFLEPAPRLFSFNNPYGSCPRCSGFGETLEYDPTLVVPNEDRSLEEGAVDPWAQPRYSRERNALRRFAAREGVSPTAPWRTLAQPFRDAVLYGTESFQGVMDFLVSKERKRYRAYIRVFLRRYQRPSRCPACDGTRLKPQARQVRVGGREIASASAMPLEDLRAWLAGLELRPMEARVAATILQELSARVGFLLDVGLGYLSLNRQMRTVSGGEAQRIALANSLGSTLVDTLYVLDEPSIGLHPRDVGALMRVLARLRDAGSTVVVVEHHAAAVEAADHVVELGPGAGEGGGEVVFQGPPAALLSAETSAGRSLSGRFRAEAPPRRRLIDLPRLRLEGADLHNLQGVDVEFPVGAMTVVTGVSGSGKSTLVHDVLYRALERTLGGGETTAKEHMGEAVGDFRSLTGHEHLAGVVLVDQSPIGRTPRSNPVTYVKAWGEVRHLFAAQPAAASAGLAPGAFSFNVEGGRCEACKGAGHVAVEMVFMADVHVPCELCGGKRYRPEVLDVKVRGMDVSAVLGLTVDRAMRFFIRERKLGQALWHLQQAGLGYLRLGQPATTLSGGEAQRLKIARELIGGAKSAGRKLYILDEPTTGLSGEDVAQLNEVLRRLVDAGNTLVVVEHDLDVVAAADWVVDMGPGAGAKGGRVVATGRPEEVARTPASVTGRYLRGALDASRSPAAPGSPAPAGRQAGRP